MAETKNGIKYPDNYNSVADIPKDLKDMAESIDAQIANKVEKENGKGLSTNDFTNADKEKLDGLNNYDDTEIKEEISDIQKEQKIQNEDISTLKAQKEALEKEVQSLREDAKLNGLTEDNSGELIHIDNSTGSRFNALEISGNEKQETREGYNLYNVKNLEKVPGQTVDEDDFITLEKTVAQSIDSYMNAHLKVSSALKANTNYWLVIEVKEFSGISKFILNQYLVESKTQIRTDVSLIEANQKAGTYKYKVTTSEDFTGMAYCLRTFAKFNADTTGKIVFRMSLLEQEPDLDTFKYQKYGAMPSFDYSSEVKCVGDNINIFDGETELGGFGETGDKTNSSTTIRNKNPIYVKGLNKIIFSCNSEPQAINFYEYDKNNSFLKYTKLAKNKYLELDANTECVNFSRSNTIDVSKIKVEKGEKVTAYSKFKQGNLHLKVLNKNFLDIQKNATVTKGGMTFTTDKDGVLTINGTATTNIYLRLDNNNIADNDIANWAKRILKKGTYVFSVENLSGQTQDINMSAFIRNVAYAQDYAILYRFFKYEKTKSKFVLNEDVEGVVYLWIYSGITLNNAKLKFQLELEQEATDIVANEEQNYVIPVQQRMFKQDKFIKINGVWKEMHTMGTVYSKDISNIVVSGSAVSGVEGFYRYNVNLQIANRKGGSYIRILSNYFKYGDSRWNNKEGICGWENGQSFSLGTYNKNYDTANKVKTFLTENNVEFDYALAKPIYLDCTPEQVEILDKIEQEAHTYSEITNIYTEDEVGAILKTNTAVDLKTVINNIQEQLIAE